MTGTVAAMAPQRSTTRQPGAGGAVLRRVDRVFGVLLVVGAIGHTTGTLLRMPSMSAVFIWSLGSSIAAATLGALNIVRAHRAAARKRAAVTCHVHRAAGTARWLGPAKG